MGFIYRKRPEPARHSGPHRPSPATGSAGVHLGELPMFLRGRAIGGPADPAEREADEAAARVGDAPTTELGSAQVAPAEGGALAPPLQRFFEGALGRDLDGVRIHAGAEAAAAADQLGASAFTAGDDVGFAAGAYAPHTSDGLRLLGHELAHTGQPGGEVRRAPTPLTVEQGARVDRVQVLLLEELKKLGLDKGRFKKPLRERVSYYADDKSFGEAKAEYARRKTNAAVDKMTPAEIQKWRKDNPHPVNADESLEDAKNRLWSSKNVGYITSLFEPGVAGFYDDVTGTIHVRDDRVGTIAHEAGHMLSNPAFREVLGAEADEGFTSLLNEKIELAAHEGFVFSGDDYVKYQKWVEGLIAEGKWKYDDVLRAYLTGDKKLLAKLKAAAGSPPK